MHGQGSLFYDEGELAYKGQWVADQFHGVGTLFNECPRKLEANFDYSDFDLVEDCWVSYKGNDGCSQVNLRVT